MIAFTGNNKVLGLVVVMMVPVIYGCAALKPEHRGEENNVQAVHETAKEETPDPAELGLLDAALFFERGDVQNH